MTRRRRTANPIFQQPLTMMEDAQAKKQKFPMPKPEGKLILCSKCKTPGGTLIKVGDYYEHQDKKRCRVMQLAKKLKK